MEDKYETIEYLIIRSLKNISVKRQLYEFAARLREREKEYLKDSITGGYLKINSPVVPGSIEDLIQRSDFNLFDFYSILDKYLVDEPEFKKEYLGEIMDKFLPRIRELKINQILNGN